MLSGMIAKENGLHSQRRGLSFHFSDRNFRICNYRYSCDGKYEGDLESKERFAIKKYLLIIGKKKNMQVLSHTFIYFST